ncbi:DUF177 domain-containing protein [Streptococcus cuniculipharyngis]|uniref:DUF177 domain-containing protein n=1 Tax=Streptococcus cuniculipharyngis TaxID=1562651 RepID=A0A5C5SB98_9STRE|nr:YceD family protein [Streptococcus cuniculipharyngis]TWS98157.1 DUF177 domain-containing protein [Streptococcus cuniculipharyngis]
MFYLSEVKKNPDGLSFEKSLDVTASLQERQPDVLAVRDLLVKGQVSYEDGLYHLVYDLSYVITLPSSRSLEPVDLAEQLTVDEVFIEGSQAMTKQDLVEENLVLIVEGDSLDLTESVIDNILLNIPLKVLTAEESQASDLPSGSDWAVLTEDQYQNLKEQEKEANNPFAALDGLFDE